MTAHDILKPALSLALTATSAFAASSWETPTSSYSPSATQTPSSYRSTTPRTTAPRQSYTGSYGTQAAGSYRTPTTSAHSVNKATPVYRQPSQTRQPAYQEPVRQKPVVQEYDDASDDYVDDLYSQHLDANVRNVYSYGAAYVGETQFGPYGVTDMVDADLEFRLFKFDEFLGGKFDAWGTGHLIYFIENPGMGSLPDGLIDASLDVGQTWRFVTGWSTEFRAAPGIYSDVTAPSFGIPVTINFYYAFCPELSLQLGATYRPDWDFPVIPNIGFAWQPFDAFRLEAMCPRSRVVLFPGYILSFFGTYEWRNITYTLSGDDGGPEDITLDDMFVTAGAALTPFGDYSLVGEYGVFIERELSADVAENNAIDLSKESFIRVMIKGSF